MQLGASVARPLLDEAEEFSSDGWEVASRTLARLGEEAAPTIIEALREPEDESLTHTIAVTALGEMAEDGHLDPHLNEAIEVLTARLGEEGHEDIHALHALQMCRKRAGRRKRLK